MAGESFTTTARDTSPRPAEKSAPSNANLLQDAWRSCKSKPDSAQCAAARTGLPQDFTIVDGASTTGGTGGTGEQRSRAEGPNNKTSAFAHGRESALAITQPTLQRTAAELNNVKSLLEDSTTSGDDKLRAAAVLAANGLSSYQSIDGTSYSFALSTDGAVKLSVQEAKTKGINEFSATVGPDGNIVSARDQSATNNSEIRSPKDEAAPPKKGVEALMDPTLSLEDKLRAAQEMAHNGQRRFKGPDGKTYEIATRKYGDREAVTVFEGDGKGHVKPILRGIIDKDHRVSEQKDSLGHGVGLQSEWGRTHDRDNPFTRHDEPREQKTDKPEKPEKPEIEKPHQESSDGRDGLKGSPEDSNHLQNSRARLMEDAEQNIYSVADRRKFEADMQKLEERAATQPLSAKEVADTYDQLSRLLEAKDGTQPKENRVLAAESFAHHMASPTNIDQGQHNTCNVTSLEEHIMTRNPSKAAEIVATAALTGQWVAPDGKVIKLDSNSLLPGPEERNFPPNDSERSYATQLMNQVLVNDVGQRKMPPMFYSQEKPQGRADTGERLRYADGTDVPTDAIRRNGDQAPWNRPDVTCGDMTESARRLTGDSNFVIVGRGVDSEANLVSVGSAQELGQALSAMKASGKLPAIIMVDINDPLFNGAGDPRKEPNWHVISVVGYDEKTGKVKLSNQWGIANDITADLNDLYRTTLNRTATAKRGD